MEEVPRSNLLPKINVSRGVRKFTKSTYSAAHYNIQQWGHISLNLAPNTAMENCKYESVLAFR
jgi:hypothetical protein